jgi:hypothetical protein
MRYFNGLLSHGEPKARLKVQFLRERLQKALELNEGLQQPDRAAARVMNRGEFEDCVHDLVAALLGRDLGQGEALAYPWGETALQAELDRDFEDPAGTVPLGRALETSADVQTFGPPRPQGLGTPRAVLLSPTIWERLDDP